MQIFLFPDLLQSGKTARIRLVGGQPGATVVVELDDGGRPEPARARLEIALNEKGNGKQDWLVPAWGWVNASCAGCEPASRSVGGARRLSGGIADAIRRLARAIEFIGGGAGREYGIGAWRRLGLLVTVLRNHRRTHPLSTRAQHLHLLEAILRLPRALRGDVVECGCFNGGSSVVLSLACALTQRRLFVCDSFEGLPEPRAEERSAFYTDGRTEQWRKGRFASRGSLDGVKQTVARYGRIEACTFVKGFFADTLAGLETDAIVMVFEDADLVSSIEDCLKHLWPKLQGGGRFYCHEPWSFDVMSLFYDKAWWRKELGLLPPGFIGSGDGVESAPYMGYAVKLDPTRDSRSRHPPAPGGSENAGAAIVV
jgi:O-methyltransferase